MIHYIRFMILKIFFKVKLIKDDVYLRKLGAKIGKNNSFIKNTYDEGHAYLLSIGDNCTITNVIFLNHDASTKKIVGKTKIGHIHIGNNCFIGMNSILLPNVTIGNNSIIGAGSVVTKDIPDNVVACGSPAKVIGSTFDYIKKNNDLMLKSCVFKKNWRKKSNKQKKKESSSFNDIAFDD